MTDGRERRFSPSRIGLRLFAFNILVVFVPVLGILYLDVYESHLRQAQENAMAQEARILAASIVELSPERSFDPARLDRVFDSLERKVEARLRVYDASGALVADSARAGGPVSRDIDQYGPEPDDTRRRPLYRAAAWAANTARTAIERIRGRFRRGPPSSPEAENGVPAEVRAALSGRYGAATRVTPGQRSLTMFSAVPIRRDGGVVGAVVASQSTYRILRALYDVRLRVLEVVLASVLVAAMLTALAAATVVRPLERLRRQASVLASRRGPSPGTFPGSGRRDELGDLARALEELTRRTNDHIGLLQSFSADVSHELKNPLASIRTAAEMMAAADSEAERARFLELMTRDVARLERLVSGLRDVAVVERQIVEDPTEAVALDELLTDVVERARYATDGRITIQLQTDAPCRVRASRDRLAQVFDNLLANAVSFAPDGSAVDVRLAPADSRCTVTVEDRGPGIPEAHFQRVFSRFFSYRPDERRGDHIGLGLAIARQIVDSYGGSIGAFNRPDGGARFEVRFPVA